MHLRTPHVEYGAGRYGLRELWCSTAAGSKQPPGEWIGSGDGSRGCGPSAEGGERLDQARQPLAGPAEVGAVIFLRPSDDVVGLGAAVDVGDLALALGRAGGILVGQEVVPQPFNRADGDGLEIVP